MYFIDRCRIDTKGQSLPPTETIDWNIYWKTGDTKWFDDNGSQLGRLVRGRVGSWKAFSSKVRNCVSPRYNVDGKYS